MDYEKLLNLGTELGRRLMCSGAEIHRTEESVTRLLTAYGVDAQVFAIPNCLITSINVPNGSPLTRMCRIPAHGTDIELLEHCNSLCRQLCRQPMPVDEALELVNGLTANARTFSKATILFGYVAAAAFFALFFGGNLFDFCAAGLCGLAVGSVLLFGQRFTGSNTFFRTTVCAAVVSACAQLTLRIGLGQNEDSIIIGTLMLLVPGMALTNAMREIMAGDITSGTNRTAEVILIATAIAIGTAIPLLVLGLH